MTSFSDLSLDPRVLQAVTESGYDTPTPIQEQAIPHALEGRDVLGIAQTGTGKTAGFVLPMVTHLAKGRARARMPRSLVLCPTRELAAQVAEQFEKYSANVKLSMALLIGGVSFKDQDKLIDRGVDVLIATPGRLLDHFERGKLMLTGVQIMVVDEADRMLDMGFIPDIERIFKLVPFTRQTLFFSATMAPEITRITEEFLHNPVRVEVARQATTSETIEQAVCKHRPSRRERADSEKRDVLRKLIEGEGEALTNGIIFCNRKRDVDIVAKSLKKHGFDAAALHGDLDQKLRMQILGNFRDGGLKLLVASDVAARGLDIPIVSHVFNFDVPIHSEDYVHRIGRTGRAGRAGKALTLCLPHEEKYLEKIEELVKKSLPVIDSPLASGKQGEEPTREEAATPAPAGRSRQRRRRGGRSQEEPAAAAPAEEIQADTETAVQTAPERETNQPREQRRGGGRNRRERDNGRSVIGMGDHVPDFILRDFRRPPPPEDIVEDAEEIVEEPAATEAETVVPNADTDVTPEAESAAAEEKPAKKRRTRRRRSAKAEDTETPVEDAAAEVAPEQENDTAGAENDTGQSETIVAAEPEPAAETEAEAPVSAAEEDPVANVLAEAEPEAEVPVAATPAEDDTGSDSGVEPPEDTKSKSSPPEAA